MTSSRPWQASPAGLTVRVRLTPKAGAAKIDGVALDAEGAAYLKVRVTAVPEKGKANAALVKLLAKAWRLPAGSLTVAAGGKDRNKTIEVAGDPETLARALDKWARTSLAPPA